jgi:hypothetical protein
MYRRNKQQQQRERLNVSNKHDNVIDLTGVTYINNTSQPTGGNGRGLKAAVNKQDNGQPLIFTINEDKGKGMIVEDKYAKYDPEPNADQFLINSGATIIRSEITLTDSSGHNRTIVRRNDNNDDYKY